MISRRREDASHGDPVDELLLGQPSVSCHGAVLEERDNGVGATEGQQARLQPFEKIVPTSPMVTPPASTAPTSRGEIDMALLLRPRNAPVRSS